MSRFENPFPDIMEATDAVTRIISLQADVFLLNQELKTLRQLKRTVWIGASLILLNLLLTFAFYWVQMGLHESGWSAYTLAFLSILFFGIFITLFLVAAFHTGREPKTKRGMNEAGAPHD